MLPQQKNPGTDTDATSDIRIHAAISRAEWRWIWTLILTVVAISCLPYLIAWINTPPGYQFGGFLVQPGDGNTYLAKMWLGWSGSWQLHLLHTPEPHDGAYLYTFYIFLGHIARWSGLPLILVYHAARIFSGLFLLLVAHSFIAQLTNDLFERRFALWLLATSAGCGWLGVLLGRFPIDLWVPEGYAFFSLLTNPHFPLAIALMLIIFKHTLWPLRSFHSWPIAAMAALGLAIVQPFAVAPVYATLGSYLIVTRWLNGSWYISGLIVAVCVATFSAPILIYDFWVATTNPVLAAWGAQNITLTPGLVDLALGYGMVGLLAVAGGVLSIRQRDRGGLLLLCWSVVTLVLVYLPFAQQLRFLTGLGIPLAILAAAGFTRWLVTRLHGKTKKRILVYVITLNALGTVFLLLLVPRSVLVQPDKSRLFDFVYISEDRAAAMQWLAKHAPNEVVIASLSTGNLLPGHAGVRVYLGHPMETVDANSKAATVARLYQGNTPNDEWKELRERYQIRYLFLGPSELAIGGTRFRQWQQDHADELTLVFQQGDVSIYQLP